MFLVGMTTCAANGMPFVLVLVLLAWRYGQRVVACCARNEEERSLDAFGLALEKATTTLHFGRSVIREDGARELAGRRDGGSCAPPDIVRTVAAVERTAQAGWASEGRVKAMVRWLAASRVRPSWPDVGWGMVGLGSWSNRDWEMRAMGRVRLFVAILGIGLIGGALGACAPITAQLREQIDERAFEDAIEDGESWLADAGDDRELLDQVRAVRRLVAEAHLGIAARTDTVDAYRAFRERFDRTYLYGPLLRSAKRAESLAYLRDVARPQGTARAYGAFRELYPDSPKMPEARNLEVEAAFAEAEATRQEAPLAAFAESYGDWPEAADRLAQSRSRRVEIGFANARTENTPPAYAAFRERYAGWPEAEASAAASKTLELDAALALAEQAGTVEAHRTFEASYGDWPEAADWIARSRAQEVDLALAAARAADTLERWRAFRARYADWPVAASQIGVARGAELRAAELALRAEPTLARYVDFRTQYRDWPEAEAQVERLAREEVELAWAHAQRADAWRAYRGFVDTYPYGPHAAEADERAAALEALRRPPDGSELRAQVTSVNERNRARTLAYVQVVDRQGFPVGGLDADDFCAATEQGPLPFRRFGGMDDGRPVDVVFVFDTTGSMAGEIDAMKAAAVAFAEQLALRSRDVRLGLVSYGDVVRHSYPSRKRRRRLPKGEGPPQTEFPARLTESVATFRRWVSTQRAVGGADADENGLEALIEASRLPFRRDAQVVLILVTDAGSHERNRRTRQSFASLGQALRKSGVNLFAISPDAAGYRGLAAMLGGRVYDIRATRDFTALVLGVGLLTAKQYLLDFGRLPRGADLHKARIRARRDYVWMPAGLLPPGVVSVTPVGDRLVATTEARGVHVSGDGGATWQARSDADLRGVWAVGGEPSALLALTADGRLLRGPVDETPWSEIEGIAGAAGVVQWPDAPDRLAVWQAGGAINLTEDGGRTWAALPAPPGEGAVTQVVVEPSRAGALLVARADGTASWTADEGRRWRPTSLKLPPGGRPEEFRIFQHPRLLGLTFALGRDGRLWKSVDHGQSWRETRLADCSKRPARRRTCGQTLRFDARRGWLVLETCDGLFVSDDRGRSWRKMGEGVDPREQSGAIYAAGGAHDAWLAASSSGQVYSLRPIADREFIASNIYFESGRHELSPRLFGFLDRLAATLRKRPRVVVRVDGHTDDVGEEDDNLELSRRRADSVRQQLVRRGVAADRIITFAHGELRPRVPNHSAANRGVNRRVELMLIEDRFVSTGRTGADASAAQAGG